MYLSAHFDATIKYEIRSIMILNIYFVFDKFSWIKLKGIKFEINRKIMRLVILICTRI